MPLSIDLSEKLDATKDYVIFVIRVYAVLPLKFIAWIYRVSHKYGSD